MKRLIQFAQFAMLGAVVAGCGIQGTAEDTLQQTKEMNAKTQQMLGTTGDMKELTAKLLAATDKLTDLTNQLLTKTGDLDKLTSDVAATTAQLVVLTKQLNGGMAKTNDGIRLQTLTLSLQTLLSDVNTESLTPPALMLPAAEKFSEVASPLEITQVYYTYVADAILGTNEGPRAHSRTKSYRAASAIVGMAPDAKMEQIFNDQVENPGRYEGTVYQLAASRYNFIFQYLFLPLTDPGRTPVLNEAVVKMAVDYFKSMKAIAKKPYAAKFTVTIPDIDPDPAGGSKLVPHTDSVDPDALAQAAALATESFTSRLSKTQLEKPSMQELLKQLQP